MNFTIFRMYIHMDFQFCFQEGKFDVTIALFKAISEDPYPQINQKIRDYHRKGIVFFHRYIEGLVAGIEEWAVNCPEPKCPCSSRDCTSLSLQQAVMDGYHDAYSKQPFMCLRVKYVHVKCYTQTYIKSLLREISKTL